MMVVGDGAVVVMMIMIVIMVMVMFVLMEMVDVINTFLYII
jgi:hypothetical protein